jgi:hypothetical protein
MIGILAIVPNAVNGLPEALLPLSDALGIGSDSRGITNCAAQKVDCLFWAYTSLLFLAAIVIPLGFFVFALISSLRGKFRWAEDVKTVTMIVTCIGAIEAYISILAYGMRVFGLLLLIWLSSAPPPYSTAQAVPDAVAAVSSPLLWYPPISFLLSLACCLFLMKTMAGKPSSRPQPGKREDREGAK